jgi:hypothetical protein
MSPAVSRSLHVACGVSNSGEAMAGALKEPCQANVRAARPPESGEPPACEPSAYAVERAEPKTCVVERTAGQGSGSTW